MIRRNSFRSGSVGSSQKVTIRLLDDNEVIQVDFQPHHKGSYLMDYVCRQLNIAEKDYFGLRYVDSTKQRHWMDLGKSITKQLKEMTPFIICFRFKFYPGDPMLLKEEVTRYQLVLQLRRDLLHGRLHSPNHSDIATLSSYIVQSELGDYDPEVNTGNYVSEYELVARQSAELEEKVKDLHSQLKGTTAAECDALFLKKAATLDTYGVDPHPVKEQHEQLFLGINHTGISTFQGSKKLTHFKWSQISKLNYEAKMFIVHISVAEDSRNRKKETAGFKCQTSKACKYLWRCAVEQRLFFTCPSAQEVTSVRGGGLFGSRFRYSGKVQKEILEDPGPLRAIDGVIQRTPLYRSLQRNKTRSLSQSPMQLGYGSLPRSNHSAPNDTRIDTGLGDLGSSSSLPLSTLSTPFGPEHGIPLLETLEEDSSPMEENAPSNSLHGAEVLKVTNMFTKENSPAASNVSNSSTVEIVDPEERVIERINQKVEEADIMGSSPLKKLVFTAALEKRRKFGTTVAPRVRVESELISNGSNSWAVVRKHFELKRIRRKLSGGGGHYEKLESTDSAPLLPNPENYVDENFESKLKQHMEVELCPPESTYTQILDSDSFHSHDDTPTSKECDHDLPRRTAQLSADVKCFDGDGEERFDMIPTFHFEHSAGDGSEKGTIIGDTEIENTLRESKINEIETPTSGTMPNFGPFLGPSPTTGKKGNDTGSNSNQRQIILSIWKIFVVCMICVLIALVFVAILAIEVDIDICQKMRRIPEIELFQTGFYEPVKYFIRDKIHNISDNISNLTFQ